MALLNRDTILGTSDVQTSDVEVPEWGGSVRVRSMTLAEHAEFVRRGTSAEDKGIVGAWMVALLVVDDKGGRVFKEEDVAKLRERNHKAIQRVGDAILDLNRVDAKKVEAAEKN